MVHTVVHTGYTGMGKFLVQHSLRAAYILVHGAWEATLPQSAYAGFKAGSREGLGIQSSGLTVSKLGFQKHIVRKKQLEVVAYKELI